MCEAYFEILRAGINSTLQDEGRFHQYHIGLPISGAIDKRNYLISNKLLGNKSNETSLEFAYQGPQMKFHSGNATGVITGNVTFKIIRANSNIENGKCYETFELNDGDQVDIISTIKSVYGYFFIKGGFEAEAFWESFSINTRAKIGPNEGAKFNTNQKLFIKNKESKFQKKRIEYLSSKIEFIRVCLLYTSPSPRD